MNDQKILLGAGTNEMELLTVWIDDQLFGINVAKVQSVQAYDPKTVTPVPDSPPGVMGMMLYRDQTIPLMDLQNLLEISTDPQDDDRSREIVVVTEFNNSVNGFRAHGVNRIFRLTWGEFVPINQFIGTNSFVTGSVQAEGHEIMVLDLEQVLETVFPGILLQSLDENVLDQNNTVGRDQIDILFAEDSYIIRKNLMHALQKAGFDNITPFENGYDALDFCLENRQKLSDAPLFPILITDIEMPKLDGLTLCKKIKQDELLKKMPVIIFSSLISPQMIKKCQQVEADFHVSKSESNNLIEVLDRFCAPKP